MVAVGDTVAVVRADGEYWLTDEDDILAESGERLTGTVEKIAGDFVYVRCDPRTRPKFHVKRFGLTPPPTTEEEDE